MFQSGSIQAGFRRPRFDSECDEEGSVDTLTNLTSPVSPRACLEEAQHRIGAHWRQGGVSVEGGEKKKKKKRKAIAPDSDDRLDRLQRAPLRDASLDH